MPVSSHQPRFSLKPRLATILLTLTLLGAGSAAVAATPAVVPLRDTGSPGGGGAVAGVQEMPARTPIPWDQPQPKPL